MDCANSMTRNPPQHDPDTLPVRAQMAEYLWSNQVPGGRYTKVSPSFVVEKMTSPEKITFFQSTKTKRELP